MTFLLRMANGDGLLQRETFERSGTETVTSPQGRTITMLRR